MRIARFRCTDYLDDDSVAAEFLTAALEDSDPRVFLTALRDVAKARRTPVARAPRKTLRFDKVRELVGALGFRLSVSCSACPSPAQRAELDRRLDAYAIDRTPGRSAPEVIAGLRRRLRRQRRAKK